MEDRLVLAHFKVPGHVTNDKYGIYKGECATTDCERLTYKMVGGVSYGMIEYGGYSGKHYTIILTGRTKAIRVSYDAALSQLDKPELVMRRYLASIGRLEQGLSSAGMHEVGQRREQLPTNEKRSSDLLKEGTQSFQDSCKTKTSVSLDSSEFAKEKLSHLTGMAKYFLTEIASACADKDYRKVLAKITQIDIVPSVSPKAISLVDQKLTIYLTPETFNPADEAKAWIQKL